MKKERLAAVAVALMTFTAAPVADAQVGGLIRRAVREAAKEPEKTDQRKDSPFNSDVLEITSPNLESVVKVLTVEVQLQKEFRAELAKYPTAQEYNACQQRAAMSEEMQKLLGILDLPDNATDAQRQAAMAKWTEAGAALLKKACPLNPADWNDSRKAERLAEIRKQALAAAASGDDASMPAADLELGGPFATDEPGWGAAGLTQRQYEVLLERLDRLCGLLKDSAMADKGQTAGIKVPGTGSTIFWVFTADEVKVMSKANCQRIYDLVGQLI